MTDRDSMAGLDRHLERLSGHDPNEPLPYNCPVCKCPDSVDPHTDRCGECGVQLVADMREEMET